MTDQGSETGCPRNGITEQGNETGDGEHSKGAPSFPSREPLNARQNEPAAERLKGTTSPPSRPAREPTTGGRWLPPGRPSVAGMVRHGVWTLPILPAETKLIPPALKGGRGQHRAGRTDWDSAALPLNKTQRANVEEQGTRI